MIARLGKRKKAFIFSVPTATFFPVDRSEQRLTLSFLQDIFLLTGKKVHRSTLITTTKIPTCYSVSLFFLLYSFNLKM